ncbi:MAG: glycosyltransferase family 39 protein [Acidobacteria bacterium]|nr:glycosyltransferase family 39 protein [Acidobacteriota bacterium]
MTTLPPRTTVSAPPPPPPPRAASMLRWPLLVLAGLCPLVFLTHLSLLDLPYYWDEAGYFIPAARDIYAEGAFVPHSTLSNAHPPLVMAYLALAWKLFGFHVAVARSAMLVVSVVTLLGVFRLAARVVNAPVAAASALCTALYPVFFAQSSLAHLDMGVAALTMWGLVLYLPRRIPQTGARGDSTLDAAGESPEDAHGEPHESQPDHANLRRWASVALFALAGLAKETAILVPLTLFGWEVLCLLARRRERIAAALCLGPRRALRRSLMLLWALAPLALWFAYHYSRTGHVFGNPEYFRYNVESTLNLARTLEALWRRLAHVTAHMELWVLTLSALAAMLLRPLRDAEGERRRIEVPVQLLFGALLLAHVVALSVVGGAILARYMLPVLPLVVIICVSTLWRRVRLWALVIALVCGAFAYRSVNNPPYSFPWEENLAYRDFILLHKDAAHVLSDKYPESRVLTAWPATDELKNPYFGYLERPLKVFPVENFKREALEQAARQKSQYDFAFLYSTHGGLELEEAAQVLGGNVVYTAQRNGQWAAILKVSSEQ